MGARTLTVPKRSMPFIGSVENLGPAVGGVDPETVDEAKARGPLWLRSGSRAVTVADFEHLALEASRDVARARCLAPQAADRSIQVLIVPRLTVEPRELVLDDLALPDGLIDEVSKHLDERRILTSTVTIRAAAYQGVTVVARVVGAPGTRPEQLRDRALDALYRYINPLVGGPSGTGWPFDRDLSLGEVFALLAGVEGVVGVEQVRLFLADLAHPQGGDPQDAGQVVRIRPDELLASFRHQVLVRP